MTGVEIDFVVTDSLGALALYERIFDGIEHIEVTSFPTGQNEAVFTLYGVRMHMLDENPDYQMVAPRPDDPKPMWLNILVPDIAATFQRALDAGCAAVQPVTRMEAFGVSNAIFADAYGYLWMLHQVHRVVPFEDRVKIFEEGGAVQ